MPPLKNPSSPPPPPPAWAAAARAAAAAARSAAVAALFMLLANDAALFEALLVLLDASLIALARASAEAAIGSVFRFDKADLMASACSRIFSKFVFAGL